MGNINKNYNFTDCGHKYETMDIIGKYSKYKIFKAFNGILYLIYNNNNSLIIYNLITKQIINEVKNAHQKYISYLNHYLDNDNNEDLIISISRKSNNIKIWKFINLECIFEINDEEINDDSFYFNYNALILNINYKKYLIISCSIGFIKVYDFNNEIINEIRDKKFNIKYIESYYDKKSNETYLIGVNSSHLRIYKYNDKFFYKDYIDKRDKDKIQIKLFFIFENEGVTRIIDPSTDGTIKIWDFHSGKLLKKMKMKLEKNETINAACLWKNRYLICGINDIRIFDLKNGKIFYKFSWINYIEFMDIIDYPKFKQTLMVISDILSLYEIYDDYFYEKRKKK